MSLHCTIVLILSHVYKLNCQWIEIATESIGNSGTDKFRYLNFINEIYNNYPVSTIDKYRIEWDWNSVSFDNTIIFALSTLNPTYEIFKDSVPNNENEDINIDIISTTIPIIIPIADNQIFCKACATASTNRYGDTCWAILPSTDSNRQCGCSSGLWSGNGIYYGGQPNSCTESGCGCWSGAFAGYKTNGQAKGGLTSVGLRISILLKITNIPEIIWSDAMDPPLDTSKWQLNGSPSITQITTNSYCVENDNSANCWSVCATNSNPDSGYIYKIVPTLGYQNISLKFNIDPWAMTNTGETCSIWYSINNQDANWIKFHESTSANHIIEEIFNFPVSTSNNNGVGIKILALDTTTNCCYVSDFSLRGIRITTSYPTKTPSTTPTVNPTQNPSITPTITPTLYPITAIPTFNPITTNPSTIMPTTATPTTTVPTTKTPTKIPTLIPTDIPSTKYPTTLSPTNIPITSIPSNNPISNYPTTISPTGIIIGITDSVTKKTSEGNEGEISNDKTTGITIIDTDNNNKEENDNLLFIGETNNLIYYIIGIILIICCLCLLLCFYFRQRRKKRLKDVAAINAFAMRSKTQKSNVNKKQFEQETFTISSNLKNNNINKIKHIEVAASSPLSSPVSSPNMNTNDINNLFMDDIVNEMQTPMGLESINNINTTNIEMANINSNNINIDLNEDDITDENNTTDDITNEDSIQHLNNLMITPNGIDDEKHNNNTIGIGGEDDNPQLIKVASLSYVDSYNDNQSVLNHRNSDYNILNGTGVTIGNNNNDTDEDYTQTYGNNDTETGTDGNDDDEYNPNLRDDEFIIDDDNITNKGNVLCLSDKIWNEYINVYGNEPNHVNQLHAFIKQSNQFKDLSLNEASTIFEQRKGKGFIGVKETFSD